MRHTEHLSASRGLRLDKDNISRLIAAGGRKEAFAQLNKARSQSHGDLSSLEFIANGLVAIGEFGYAVEVFEEILLQSPDSIAISIALLDARSSTRMDRLTLSKTNTDLETIVRRPDLQPAHLLSAAIIFLRLNKMDRAVWAAREARKSESNTIPAARVLISAYLENRKRKSSRLKLERDSTYRINSRVAVEALEGVAQRHVLSAVQLKDFSAFASQLGETRIATELSARLIMQTPDDVAALVQHCNLLVKSDTATLSWLVRERSSKISLADTTLVLRLAEVLDEAKLYDLEIEILMSHTAVPRNTHEVEAGLARARYSKELSERTDPTLQKTSLLTKLASVFRGKVSTGGS